MTRIILNEILGVVILNLLYTSMYSDGSRLYPELNPIVGRPFKLVCDTETTITSTVTIRLPNRITAGYCNPASSLVPANCFSSSGYSSAQNETKNTVTISTSSLAANVSGEWTCTYIDDQASYNLTDPIREIEVETFTLFPTSFTDNITSKTASISLSATYGCINLPVFFKWFVVDSTFNKIDISGTNNAAENSSVCTSGFNGYTETKEVNEEVYSSNYVKNLNGSYRLGVEVHYMDEVTTFHSIKYFDTYFVFSSGGTNTSTKQAGNCFLTFRQFIEEKLFNCCGCKSSQESKDDPGFFKDKVCTLNSLLGFTYLVLYGVIVEVVVLLAVYYGDAKFQEGLVIGVGIVIVLVLSFMCLLVVAWLLMKFVYTSASERSSSLRCIRNGTVTPQHETCTRNGTITPHETRKSQKRATIDKRQQPDGDEGPQSTPKETDTKVICL